MTIGRNVSAIRSSGPYNLRNVDITMGIEGNVVRSEEITRSRRVRSTAPAIDPSAVSIEDADPATSGIGRRTLNAGPHSRSISQLGNVEVVITIKSDLTGTSDLRHLVDELTVRREALQAAVLAISDPDDSLRINSNPMRNMKLPRTASRFSP